MKSPDIRRWDPETVLVTQLAALLSIFSFLFYLREGDLLLYGDAVAHINIARRVFDSQTPGLLQLGTVWLPLPHLLMIPFIVSRWMWHTGVGGSIPSLVAFILSVAGLFRLVRGTLSGDAAPTLAARLVAWGAVLIYAANPNLIYLQSTAMTEALYLAWFIWALVYFSEFTREIRLSGEEVGLASRSLLKCGLCLAGGCLTRYDGWFLAGVLWLAALAVTVKHGRKSSGLRRGFVRFTIVAAAAPLLWLAYNGIVYRNPLQFANGPYSAKGIEERTASPEYPTHPGANDLPEAASFFLKSAEMNSAPGNWGRFWLAFALLGTAVVVILERRYWALLLLWVPLPFYMLSIAHGGVPIFLPIWWPHSYYNVRYGVQLLPVFAVFVPLAAYALARIFSNTKYRTAVACGLVLLTGVSYGFVWRDKPISFQEAWVNSRTRIALEKQIAIFLEIEPSNSVFLMYLGDHVGAFQTADIPLRRVIYAGNHRTWMQPRDPDGLWERALANPGKYVDYVIALAGDPVSEQVNRSGLTPLEVIHVLGQPVTTIYSTGRKQRPR